ncbi:hypothetical protein VIGAN_04262700 [Vigna angularis var. angularis]|uniref:Uncharacterized protein n=1 Tax=Vigna angularis var. angularis TaxID=157739 RepID=A0A0S3RX03_PHAAN|nr:hypothetical protein VIGAN_04262700 [Vigna angularis var. angularis]
MMKAQMVEDKIRIMSKGRGTTENKGRGKEDAAGTINPTTKNQGINRNRGTPFRKLSAEEMQDKIRKGLCFICDEKFRPNSNKQLHMLLVTEHDVADGDGILDDTEDSEKIDEGARIVHSSIFAMAGLITKKSWKVWGKIGDTKVVVLLDFGASHNFISKEFMCRCRLEPVETLLYVVEVGDGRKVQCQGKCTGFVLEFLLFIRNRASKTTE